MTSKKILVGLPCGSGFVPTVMVTSLLQLHKPFPCAFAVVDRQRVDKARNYMAMETLKQGFDYLFMVDDDNPIPPETLELMIADDKDIVIAPILSRNPVADGSYPMCAFYSEERDIKGKPLRMYHPIKEFKDEGPLHKIDAGGTGCMLIKRKVLEKMFVKYQDHFFEFGDITINGQRRTMSEDAEFCERAVDLGFEIWLDDRIRPKHIVSSPHFVQWKPNV